MTRQSKSRTRNAEPSAELTAYWARQSARLKARLAAFDRGDGTEAHRLRLEASDDPRPAQ